MTNITLSIEDSVYNKMKNFSEVKWSEFVRKCIQQRVNELAKLSEIQNNEGFLTMIASEEVLSKNWLSKEDEEAWKDL